MKVRLIDKESYISDSVLKINGVYNVVEFYIGRDNRVTNINRIRIVCEDGTQRWGNDGLVCYDYAFEVVNDEV